MYPDIVHMMAFYSTPLGRHCQQAMINRLAKMWPDLDGMQLGSFGYALPVQAGLMQTTKACIMPAPMGVTHWPAGMANKTALAEETHLPLPDESMDRFILCHALEHVDSPRHFLREVWRITAAEGRVIFIVPNRRSLWARSDRTPFGHGRPFSRGQLTKLLQDNMFDVTSWSGVFYGLPGTGALSARFSRVIDPWGRRLWGHLPGVWMVEARKRVTAPLTRTQTVRQRAYAAAGLSSSRSSMPSSSYDSTNRP